MPAFIRFASDATLFAIWGAGLLVLSVLAFLGDRRRMRRSDINAVGLVPWRDLSAYSAFAGLVLLVVGLSGFLKG